MRYINRGSQETKIDYVKAAQHYNAKYLADLTIETTRGWSDAPVAVFYQPNPKPEHSHYFGLYFRGPHLFICDAKSVAEGIWNASQAENGEVIFSRYRHDYVESKDKTAMVDGGRDYFRYNGKPIKLKVVEDNFVIVEGETDES